METKHVILHNWDQPLDNMNDVIHNCNAILNELYNRFGRNDIHIVGIGTSGTVLMTVIMLLIRKMEFHGTNVPKVKPIILQKPGIKSSSSQVRFERGIPIVIIDDDLVTGRTLDSINDVMYRYDAVNFTDLLKNVEGVAIRHVKRILDFEGQKAKILEFFPEVKFWLY